MVGKGARNLLSRITILFLLDAKGRVSTVAELLAAHGMNTDGGELERVLRDLEKQGLLRRGCDEGDNEPQQHYALTDVGKRLKDRLAELLSDLLPAPPDAVNGALTRSAAIDPVAEERATLAAERQEFEVLRSDLLSAVSHELRTPLTLIRTSVGLLLDSDLDSDMHERLLRNIKQSSDRMHALVNDLLDLIRLRNGRAELQLRYVDSGELVAGVANLVKPLVDEKGQMLEIEVPSPAPTVLGDSRRLEQVLLNLLSNANKFAPPTARIRIGVREEEQSVTLSVSDTGPGIPPEAQLRLFEQFYTARTSSPSHNIGAGLGLPIAKGIVEAHGGHIWFESEVGLGSTFYFSLPKNGPWKEETDEDTSGR